MNPRKIRNLNGKPRWACSHCGCTWAEDDETGAKDCCAGLEIEELDPDLFQPLPEVEMETNPVHVARPEPSMPEVKAPELLGRAAMHMHDRAATYDKPEGERSMGRAVEAFNAVTGRNLTESEGWLLLAQLKHVRLFTRTAYHADSAEDAIAYTALMAEARGAGR